VTSLQVLQASRLAAAAAGRQHAVYDQRVLNLSVSTAPGDERQASPQSTDHSHAAAAAAFRPVPAARFHPYDRPL